MRKQRQQTHSAICILLFAYLFSLPKTQAQTQFTANDSIRPYRGGFRAGVNFDIYRGFSDEDLAILAAGSDRHGAAGVGAKAVRPGFFEDFAELFGYDSRLNTFRFYDSLGLKDNTMMVGFPSAAHRDTQFYCPTAQSTVFKNMYAPIWDNGENGTPVNDTNYYALYIWKTATRYHKYVRFFEVWNEPGFDFTGGLGWRARGTEGNWWDNNPNPCDYKLRAPIFNYVRLLRITYEVVKSVDPSCYVVTSGLGYPSFLDAILRNTDNPSNGQVTPQYPRGGGAYFDGIAYHAYPHFDDALRRWNDTRGDWDYFRHSDAAGIDPERIKKQFEAVLTTYGYNAQRYPKKMFLITEANLPRKEFGTYIGSSEAQKNWIPKALINCLKNDIWQLHVFKLADETTEQTAIYEFDLMGFYKKIHYANKLRPEMTDLAISYKTAANILLGKVYDSTRTRQMNLPPSVEGIAMRDSNGIYTYALWAKTTVDKSEQASATYSFPTAWGNEFMIKREWHFSKTQTQEAVQGLNLQLTATPIYLTERKIRLSQQFICEGATVSFEDLTPSVSRTWAVEISPNLTTIETAKSFNKTFMQRGNYKVHLVAKDATGREILRQTQMVHVERTPTVGFNALVENPSVKLINLSSPNTDSLVWTFSDGTRSNLPDLTKYFAESGIYTVNLQAHNRCGSPSLQKAVRINAPITTPNLKTARDTVPAYDATLRAGVNMQFVQGWTDEQIADIAAGNREAQIDGVHARSLRTNLPEYFTKFWGADIRRRTLQHFENLDLKDIVLTIGYPDSAHRDPNFYCHNAQSSFFKNMYTPIWDSGENGTIVNDSNYFARYVHDLVKIYKNEVKFWEIWNTPGWDIEGKNGWKDRSRQHNWWQNNPDPCELGTKAPVQHLVRLHRIAYEVIKQEDPSAFVVFSGAGFPSFLDAMCRNTDNPEDGRSTPQYPLTGAAYFDAVLYNVFPHFDGSLSAYDPSVGGVVFRRNTDAAAMSIEKQKNDLQSVLSAYGYDGRRFPAKKFLIGEINVPRKPLNDLKFGSDEVQRNFIIKAYVTAAKNGLVQMNVKTLADEATDAQASDASQVMGLYKKLGTQPYNRTMNIEGIAFRTMSALLYGLYYDSARTRQLNLPPSVSGGAFRDKGSKWTYVLWAKSEGDLVEWGNTVYDFPNTLGISRLYQRDWAYSENRRMAIINPTNIALSTTPVFLSEDSTIVSPPLAAFFSNAQKACPVLTVQYRDTSAHATSVLWRFSGGNPATSTARNPTVQYAKSGKYDVVLEVHNAQGVHENRKIEHVEVDSVPKADFDFRYDSARLKLVFTNTSRNSFSMIWDFGDGSPQVFSLHATHTFAARRTYTVRLIAFNACGQDTIYKTIDTRVTSVFEKTPELVGFQSFPNPFGTDFSVQFDLAKAAYLQFDLVDITGRLVQNLSPMRFYTEGGQMATFTPIDLPNGLYFLQIKKEGQGVILVKRLCKYGD